MTSALRAHDSYKKRTHRRAQETSPKGTAPDATAAAGITCGPCPDTRFVLCVAQSLCEFRGTDSVCSCLTARTSLHLRRPEPLNSPLCAPRGQGRQQGRDRPHEIIRCPGRFANRQTGKCFKKYVFPEFRSRTTPTRPLRPGAHHRDFFLKGRGPVSLHSSRFATLCDHM